MTDAPDSPEEQSLGEAETIARAAGAVDDAATSVEDADLPADQPRGEIETAAAARAEQAAGGGGGAGFEERVEPGLLPGEVVGTPKPPAGPYQFLPGDGQAEGQDERNADWTAAQAEQAPSEEDDDEGKASAKSPSKSEAKPKAKKAKKEQD